MKARVIVTTLIEKDGRILLGEKPKDVGPYPNTWHLPGGGVDLENESLEDAVRREIKEETGLDVENMTRMSFDEDYEPDKRGEMTHYLFLVYKVTPTSMNARAADDIVKLKWFEKSELKKLPLTRPSVKFFQEIGWI
jgi:ADP-ribose pyrophosphatase YjhB (NUDIX family)